MVSRTNLIKTCSFKMKIELFIVRSENRLSNIAIQPKKKSIFQNRQSLLMPYLVLFFHTKIKQTQIPNTLTQVQRGPRPNNTQTQQKTSNHQDYNDNEQ